MNTQCDFIKVDTLSFQALPSDENHPNKNLRDSRLSGIDSKKDVESMMIDKQ